MKNTQKMIIGFSIIIGAGLYLTLDFQQNSVKPIETAMNHLQDIQASLEPSVISSHILLTKETLPQKGNAVMIYSTPSTDFTVIQKDLDSMIVNVEKISTVPRDSSSFHTGMAAISDRAFTIQQNLEDAKSYMYVSVSNVFFNFIWIIGGIGFVQSLVRRYN